jgi:hypothetical protein
MKRYYIGVLAVLLVVALGAWGWYFLTREPPHFERIVVLPKRQLLRRPSTLQWRAAAAKERGAAIASVVAQLKAFKTDDYELAVKYQSSALKQNFPSVQEFRRVIQNSYPEFAHYKTANFGAARATKNGAIIELPIILVGSNGATVRAVYSMILENGSYRVSGVSGGNARQPAPEVPHGVEDIAPLLT